MRSYDRQQDFSCEVDLHARTTQLCVLDRADEIKSEAIRKNLRKFASKYSVTVEYLD
jgi:hypothetical protein